MTSPPHESKDERDHEGSIIARWGGGWFVLCRCGWQSSQRELESEALDDHDDHVFLATRMSA